MKAVNDGHCAKLQEEVEWICQRYVNQWIKMTHNGSSISLFRGWKQWRLKINNWVNGENEVSAHQC